MKKLPIGLQTFSKLIEDDYIYVDKTALIYNLITTYQYYFFSRPRRFGKSLLVSTLADIFSGDKELFTGLAISSLPYDWKKHPVIMISFADISYRTPDELEQGIKISLQRIAREYHIVLSQEFTSGQMLQELVITLAQTAQVVLLIDEYDYPILQHLHNEQSAHAMREQLKSFYAVIKGLDKYLRFVFLTGVSKFSQTSIFSGLNNLNDISFAPEYSALLGYTHDEIVTYFQPYLEAAAKDNDYSVDQLLLHITEWYDGYLFTGIKNTTKMYNPFSVLLFFSRKTFANYWFATGTPTFLINLFKKYNYAPQDFERIEATASELGAFEIEQISLKTLLFQTGYLTIYGVDPISKNYILTYPNKETVDGLFEYVFKSITHQAPSYLSSIVAQVMQALSHEDFKQLHTLLTSFYAAVPYTIKIDQEKYYQTIFYVLFKLVGADIVVEQPTNVGRIDAIAQTKNTCYVIEMKLNATADAALQQIREKKYYQAYETLGKKIILVGIAFDVASGNVSEMKYENL
ncbi:MAG TPA: AAA family ATPase [Candidatus Babeliales bacterium]|nr:AAA family ATPase [Candidatus Babeliales bacterium]